MELDFKTIKALSSPTRIKLLHRIMLEHELQKNVTPTTLSDDLDKAKSTISSHLNVLHDAGLVERDEQEGRRRVMYAPTRKAKTIINGSERKVRFAVTSGAISGVAGAGLFLTGVTRSALFTSQKVMAESMDAAPAPGGGSGGGTEATGLVTPEIALLLGGGALLAMAVLFVLYGLVVWRLAHR